MVVLCQKFQHTIQSPFVMPQFLHQSLATPSSQGRASRDILHALRLATEDAWVEFILFYCSFDVVFEQHDRITDNLAECSRF